MKNNSILVRNIPEETFNKIVDLKAESMKQGKSKSLGLIALELIEKGLKKEKK